MTIRKLIVAGVIAVATLTTGSLASATSASAHPIFPHHGHYWGGGWGWGGPFIGGVYANSYPVYGGDDGCYVVYKKRFIPGYGLTKKRVVICD